MGSVDGMTEIGEEVVIVVVVVDDVVVVVDDDDDDVGEDGVEVSDSVLSF